MKKHPQKFERGDWVHVAADLGSMMRHFENDCDAVVLGSYQDQYGGGNTKDYSLLIFPKSPKHPPFVDRSKEVMKLGTANSWYEEWQLTKLPKSRASGLKAIARRNTRNRELERSSD